MKERMTAKRFALAVLVATISAVTLAYYAAASVQVSGIVPSNWNAAEVIRQRCPFHLISAAWIRGGDPSDILFSWAVTETRARLLAVCSGWVIAIAVLGRLAYRRQDHAA
jgi:hypothetical protein